MRGTRPLSNGELRIIADCFDGEFAIRDKSLILIGVSTGGRISELLALTLGDVYQNDKPVETLHFNKDVVKGKENSRTVPVNSDGVKAISDLIHWHVEYYGNIDPQRPCFPSRQKRKGEQVSITRQRAHQVFKDVCEKAGLNGNLATHSLRKSYAQRLYVILSDVFSVKEMLGHQDVKTTQAYLGVDVEKVRKASEAMTIGNQ
ncbi:tyrosine-type recombinase/integrase [Candidatus Poribacteria bacterium]|nr:tyrosine-type recombinase/integrase [Candidatus Poribacteria bacterium]